MKANHICKLPSCRKAYYACNACDRLRSWRSVCCSKEHYDEYVKLVLSLQKGGKKVDTLPDRTDRGKEETKELMERPVEEVVRETYEELRSYSDDVDEVGINAAVDKINKELEAETDTSEVGTKKKHKGRYKKKGNSETGVNNG